MKYQESYLGSKSEFGDFVKKAIPDLFAGRLVVEGKAVTLPTGTDYDYKVKYDEDEQGGSVTIKVAWENQSNLDINIDD